MVLKNQLFNIFPFQEEISGLISDEDDEAELTAIEKHLNKGDKGQDASQKYANTGGFEMENGHFKIEERLYEYGTNGAHCSHQSFFLINSVEEGRL